MDGMVNMDDLLTTRPGGVVRTKQPPNQVMQPLQSQPISQQAFPMLSYLDSVREARTDYKVCSRFRCRYFKFKNCNWC
jgi:hypothetical protein